MRENSKNSQTIAECLGLEYVQVRDYFLPNIVLTEHLNAKPLGHYDMMCRVFLKEHRKITYGILLNQERLYSHCHEVEELAVDRLMRILNTLLSQGKTNGTLPDKASDPISCTAHLWTIRKYRPHFFGAMLLFRKSLTKAQFYPILKYVKWVTRQLKSV